MILRGRSSINGCDLPTEVVDFALDGYGNEVGNAERISRYFLGVKKCLDFWDTRTLDCNASQPWISWGIWNNRFVHPSFHPGPSMWRAGKAMIKTSKPFPTYGVCSWFSLAFSWKMLDLWPTHELLGFHDALQLQPLLPKQKNNKIRCWDMKIWNASWHPN